MKMFRNLYTKAQEMSAEKVLGMLSPFLYQPKRLGLPA